MKIKGKIIMSKELEAFDDLIRWIEYSYRDKEKHLLIISGLNLLENHLKHLRLL